MIVGEQIRIQGTVEGAEDLVVRGRVEGTLRIAGTVTIEPGAWVIADVQAREVIVRGTLRGSARASGGIEVARTGRMVGDAIAPRVTIAAGAGFRGRVEMGEAPGADEAPPPFPPVAAEIEEPAPVVAALPAVAPAPAPPPKAVPAPAPTARTTPAATIAPSAPAASRGIPPLSRPGSTMKRRAE